MSLSVVESLRSSPVSNIFECFVLSFAAGHMAANSQGAERFLSGQSSTERRNPTPLASPVLSPGPVAFPAPVLVTVPRSPSSNAVSPDDAMSQSLLQEVGEGEAILITRQAGAFQSFVKGADGTFRLTRQFMNHVVQPVGALVSNAGSGAVDRLRRSIEGTADIDREENAGMLLGTASGAYRSIGLIEEPGTPLLPPLRKFSRRANDLLENLPEHTSKEVRDFLQQATEQAESPSASEERKDRRVYYVDWIRIMAIYLVVVFHTVQALDDYVGVFEGNGRAVWGPDGFKGNDEDQPTKERILVENFQTTCLMVGMPLFFHISGRAQALGRPATNFLSIFIQRLMRLFLPFVVVYALLIPVWMWIQWPIAPPEAQQSLWRFELWYWNPENWTLQTAWLWFLASLFMITVMAAPFIVFAETKHPIDLLIVVVSVVVTLYALTSVGKLSWKFATWSVTGSTFSTALSLIIPFPDRQGHGIDGKLMTWAADIIKWERFRKFEQSFLAFKDKWQQLSIWVALRLSTGVQICTSVVLVRNFKYSELPQEWMPAMMLFYGFYIQGYFSERWSQGSKDLFLINPKVDSLGPVHRSDDYIMKIFRMFVRLYQITAAMFMLMALFSSCPAGRRERMLYPAYSAGFKYDPDGDSNIGFGVCHVLGTWAWLTVSLGLGQAYLNHVVQKQVYKHASASTMVVYIFHWMFLKYIAVCVLHKFHLNGGHYDPVPPLFWKFADFIFLFVCSVGGSLLIYFLLLKSPKWLPVGKLFGL